MLKDHISKMTSSKSMADAVNGLKTQLSVQSVIGQRAKFSSCGMRESHKCASSVSKYQILRVRQALSDIFPTVKVLFSVSSSQLLESAV